MCGKLCVVELFFWDLKLSSPMLEQTSHPPTRNLVGKTHANLNQRIGARAPMAQDRSLLQDPRWRRRCGRRRRRDAAGDGDADAGDAAMKPTRPAEIQLKSATGGSYVFEEFDLETLRKPTVLDGV